MVQESNDFLLAVSTQGEGYSYRKCICLGEVFVESWWGHVQLLEVLA